MHKSFTDSEATFEARRVHVLLQLLVFTFLALAMMYLTIDAIEKTRIDNVVKARAQRNEAKTNTVLLAPAEKTLNE